mmetsp:Transcript_14755/g.43032  ORF Transcript_14755/g.43032 Transcript_14755/m.43032 type:complete len:275 (-) Transcript_14755:107-931(-)
MGCSCCCECFKKYFGADRLDWKLDTENWKEVFGKPGGLVGALGCMSPRVFLVTRLLIFVVWCGCVAWSMADWVDYAEFKYWWTKLTHIGALIELVYFFFAYMTSFMAICTNAEDGRGDKTPWYASVTWFLGSTVMVITFMVFLLYWVLVFEPGPGKPEAISVVMHGGNFALALLDLCLNRQPFYLAHAYAPGLFSAAYALFTYIYYKAGGTFEDGVSPYIYAALDWSGNASGTRSLLALLVLVGVPVIYVIFFLVAMARIKCRMAAEAKDSDAA